MVLAGRRRCCRARPHGAWLAPVGGLLLLVKLGGGRYTVDELVKKMKDVFDRPRLLEGRPFEIHFSQFGLYDQPTHVSIRIGKGVYSEKAGWTREISCISFGRMCGETKIV